MKIYNQKVIPLLEYLISKENKNKVSVDIKSSLKEGDIIETKHGLKYCILSNKTIKRYYKQYKHVLDLYLDNDRILYIWHIVMNNPEGGWPVCWDIKIYDSQLDGSKMNLKDYSVAVIYKSSDNKVPDNCKDLNDNWIEKEISKRKKIKI